MFDTLDLGVRPDDDLSDIDVTVTDETPGRNLDIFDPIAGAGANVVTYDVQAVPVPASVFLLGGALASLGALRRKARSSA